MRMLLLTCLFAGWIAPAWAQVDQFMRNMVVEPSKRTSEVSEEEVGYGVREALRVAAQRAVDLSGRPNGFYGNALIRITLPDRLEAMDKALRAVGQGPQLAELVTDLNRVAEQSVPSLRRPLEDAAAGIAIDHPRAIRGGGDTAATEYLRSKAGERLSSVLTPVVARLLADSGTKRRYDELVEQFRALPGTPRPPLEFDLNGYLAGAALEGLFLVMGEQERQIRTEPAARSSVLLRDVFGR